MPKPSLLVALAFASVATSAEYASASCGFFVPITGSVSSIDSQLYNEASVVVLMRHGTRTIVSMQNDYEGPPSEFALVVPVPEVLQEGDVKTLPREHFAYLDRVTAPRLVEFWEQDPCAPIPSREMGFDDVAVSVGRQRVAETVAQRDLGVTVEAQFEVDEYDVSILGAQDSLGLEAWLQQNHYAVPSGASEMLRPYIANGMKFFVAKVDPSRLSYVEGRAVLSPLRFHYDSPELSLPIRLGTLNSKGEQDVVVHILADRRYEAANYENVRIPTNLVVPERVRDDFPRYYDRLFERAISESPGTVVTEFAAGEYTCPTCANQPLRRIDLEAFGRDVLFDEDALQHQRYTPVLTRLHTKVGADTHGEDLIFQEANILIGGMGLPNAHGMLTQASRHLGQFGASQQQVQHSSFQARYSILNRWDGPVECPAPHFGFWGDPPNGGALGSVFAPAMPGVNGIAASGSGSASGASTGGGSTSNTANSGATSSGPITVAPGQGGCASCAVSGRSSVLPSGLSSLVVGLALLTRRRRSVR